MAMDMVQIRWQNIRLCEKMLAIQNENTMLRQQLVAMKDFVKRSSNQNSLQRLEKVVKAWINESRVHISNSRVSYNKQLFDISNEATTTIYRVTAMFTEKLSKEKKDKQNLHLLFTSVQHELDAVKGKMQSSSELSSQEAGKWEATAKRLKGELAQSNADRNKVQNELDLMKLLLAKVQGECADHQQASQDAGAEVRKLKQQLKKVVEEHMKQLDEARDEAEVLRQEVSKLEQLCHSSSSEISLLRERITELESQVYVLEQAQSDKTHFAKFMQLKQENSALQSQLASLSKKDSSGKHKSSKLTPVSGNVVAPRRSSFGVDSSSEDRHLHTIDMMQSSGLRGGAAAVSSSASQPGLTPGIPLMGKSTRDALRKRLDI